MSLSASIDSHVDPIGTFNLSMKDSVCTLTKPVSTESIADLNDSTEAKQRFCFLVDFPREIRDEVYKYALVVDGNLRRIWYKDAKPGIDIDIMLLNRQVYDEAFQVFYRLNTFSIPYLAFSSNVEPNRNPWLPRNARPSEKQLDVMRQIELCNPLGSLDVFYFNLYHLQEAWQYRDDIKYLSFKGSVQLHNYTSDEFDALLESIRQRLESFFTFRNIERVEMSLILKERDLPSLWSEWEMAKCWESWAAFLQSMRRIMEGPREYARPIILPWPVSLELWR